MAGLKSRNTCFNTFLPFNSNSETFVFSKFIMLGSTYSKSFYLNHKYLIRTYMVMLNKYLLLNINLNTKRKLRFGLSGELTSDAE